MATQEKENSPTLVEEFKTKAKERMKELEPAVREHAELTEFLDARKPSSNSTARAPRQSHAGRGGKRAEEFTNVVRENPGITVTEVAKKMGIQPNYLYRISGDLAKEGKIVKDGRGLKVAA